MRRCGNRLVYLIASATLLLCVAAAPASAGWSKPNPVSFSKYDAFTALGFATPQVGWVVGANSGDGVIRKTIDGGATWTTENTGSLLDGSAADAIQVIDAQTVIVAAENNHILKTVDGGDSWTQVNDVFDFDGLPLGVSFTDVTHGWLAVVGTRGPSQVYKTTDGGKTWALPSPRVNESGPLRGIDFYDANNGIATGFCYDDVSHRDYVWRTTDGGASWAKSFLPVDAAAVPDGAEGPTGNQYKDYTYAVVNLDATHAWVVGGWGAIFFSSDNGLTWTRQQAVDRSYDLLSVDFVDASHGWAVGSVSGGSAVILHTVDGGAHWTRQPATLSPGVYYNEIPFVGIDFVSVNRGFVCSEFDVVLKATNGGDPGESDETAPSTTAVSAPSSDGASVNVTLTARDDAAGSGMIGGLAGTEYKLVAGKVDAFSMLFPWSFAAGSEGGLLRAASWQPYDAASGIVVSAPGDSSVGYRSSDNAGNVEVAKSVSVHVDAGSTPTPTPSPTIADTPVLPTTTDDAPAGWESGAVNVRFTATAGTSPVRRIEYKLGDAASWTSHEGADPLVLEVTTPGVSTIAYRAVDTLGAQEPAQTCTVNLDSIRPTTTALKNVSVKKGKKATLDVKVGDLGGSPTCTVVVEVLSSANKVVKRIALGRQTVGSPLHATFTCTLKAGVYSFRAQATDLAGNTVQKPLVKRLLVK